MKSINIRLAPWIAYQNYFTEQPESRSIVINEKTHELNLLEGESSDIFAKLCVGSSYEKLCAYAEKLEVLDAIPDFLAELEASGLILTQEFPPEALTSAPTEQTPQQSNDNLFIELKSWVLGNGFLFAAHWDMTYQCNESCKHCYNRCMAKPIEFASQKELSTQDAFAMIDELAALGVVILYLSGGEATLRKDFFEILAYARYKGLSVELFSNGLNMDAEFVDKLSSYYLHRVGISIYSAEPLLHDEITGVQGSFERSIASIKRLLEAGIKTEIKCVLMRKTIGSYRYMLDLANELGCPIKLDVSMSPGLDGSKAPMELAFTDFNELVAFAASEDSPIYCKLEGNVFDKSGCPKNPDKSICGIDRGALYIDPFGNIMPCMSLSIPVVNIKNSGIKTLWQKLSCESKHEGTFDSSLQRLTLKDFAQCGSHDYCPYCIRICPGVNLLENKDPCVPSGLTCLHAKARKKASELLESGCTRDDICIKLGIPVDFGRLGISLLEEQPD